MKKTSTAACQQSFPRTAERSCSALLRLRELLHKRHGARRGDAAAAGGGLAAAPPGVGCSHVKRERARRPPLSPGRLAHTYAATSSSSSACSMAFSGGSSSPSRKGDLPTLSNRPTRGSIARMTCSERGRHLVSHVRHLARLSCSSGRASSAWRRTATTRCCVQAQHERSSPRRPRWASSSGTDACGTEQAPGSRSSSRSRSMSFRKECMSFRSRVSKLRAEQCAWEREARVARTVRISELESQLQNA